MTERTALFLAGLSHQWFLVVLPLPVLFGVAAYGVGIQHERARAGGDISAQRITAVLHRASCGLFAVSIGVFGIAFFHVGCAALKAHSTQCLSNIKQLSLGALLYMEDYDERLPASAQWAEAIEPRVRKAAKSDGNTENDPFHCPAAESPAGYGMNAALGGVSLSDVDAPADTVLLFDADAPTRSFAGGFQDIARRRHSDMPNVAFVDGHARGLNASVLKKLSWTPTQANGQPRNEP